MKANRVAVIGINLISASVALGLREQKEPIEIVGYDADRAIADLAKVRGVFDEVRRKPGPTCEGAYLVIVSERLPDIEETFLEISCHLEAGAVVTDTARLKAPVLRWAEKILPERVSFVGGHCILNPAVVGLGPPKGLGDASADLVKDALYCFTPSPKASSGAIETCSWLAHTIGAHPFFLDVDEHDGLQAGIEGLPDLLTIALLRATVDTPGWEEMRKFATHRFATATEAIEDAVKQHPSIYLNRENILRRLDALMEELMYLRSVLSEGDEEALAETAAKAADSRDRWMEERRRGTWSRQDAPGTQDVPGAAQQVGHMIFGNLVPRFGQTRGKSEEE